MARVVMKWGGGLITDKNSLCTALPGRMNELASIVSEIIDLGHQVIIVHGAGSFGHIRAIEYNLSAGRDYSKTDDWQTEGIGLVQRDMDTLHEHVILSLQSYGLEVVTHRPRDFAFGTGPHFDGNIVEFISDTNVVHTTYGDIVDCPAPAQFGILSGDDLMLRLSMELPDISHAIFALGDTPGLMTKSPDEDGAELISEWTYGDDVFGTHQKEIDATGGIHLKIARASAISQQVEHVWFVDGCHPGRILELINEGFTTGTRILP